MSGGIAYVYDIDGSFKGKCNPEMVELCKLDNEDITLVKALLKEFHEKTGSKIADQLFTEWETHSAKFVKVFPYEYQRALKAAAPITVAQPTAAEPNIKDIEDAIIDVSLEQKKLDKLRGFMKYQRETGMYRPAEKRMKDWDEVYNHTHVRKGLRVQAARCMECGVPFCQSNSHGCPLGTQIYFYIVIHICPVEK